VSTNDVPPPTLDDFISDDKKLIKHLEKATPQVGAEHTPFWLLGVASSNPEPADIKAHVLRFLGMYNVCDLLTFTIGSQFLLESASNHDPENLPLTWFDPLIFFFCSVSCAMSGIGLLASTILYNTASSVHEVNFAAFARAPATGKTMLFVNDLSIFGFGPLIMASILSTLKIAHQHNSYSTPLEIACAVVISLCVFAFIYLMSKFPVHIALTTHYSLYGGLMAAEEVIPGGETTGWATRWSPEEVGAFLNKTCHKNTDFRSNPDYGMDMIRSYAKRTDEIRSEATEEEQYTTRPDDIVAQVSAVLAAKKRRSSFDKGEWGLAR
jgi:hypothetical protein